MDVNRVFPTSAARASEPSARQSSARDESFEQVLDQTRNSAAVQSSPKTGAPAPKPLAQRPAAEPPAKADTRPAMCDPIDKSTSSAESNRPAPRPASDKPAAKDCEVRSTAEDAVKTVDAHTTPAPVDSAITLAANAAPEIAPVAPLSAENSPAAQQIALIAQALGLPVEAPPAPPPPPAPPTPPAPPAPAAPVAPTPAAANAPTAPVAPTLAVANATSAPVTPAAVEVGATTTAKLAVEFAALAHAASGDDGMTQALPDTPQTSAPVGAALPAAAPLNFSSHATPATAPALPAAPVHASPGQPAFAGEFGNRVMLMAQGQVKSAQIALNPGDLGPVEVRLELRGQEASLVMSAAHPATRAALEDALPRLREMFAAQGLELAEAHVGAESRGDSNPSGEDPPRRGGGAGPTAVTVANAPVASTRARGLVDTFA